MSKIKDVLILNHSGAVVFQGKATLTNFEKDQETTCLIADCKLEDNTTVLVWKIDGIWQGWL